MNNLTQIANFLKYLSLHGVSLKSLKYYKSDLVNFLNWSGDRKVTTTLIQEYISSARLITPVSTLNRRISTLKSFGNFMGFKKTAKSWQDSVLSKFESKQKFHNLLNKLFFSRPNWYRKYHSYQLATYIHVAILVLFTSLSGYALYDQVFRTTDNSLAFPTALTRPNRYLSFQGRLTDNLGNPKTVATNMVFKLYSVSTGGTALWDSGTCSITPDQDGIFSTLLGSSCGAEIASTVFSENASIWLGATMGADAEATPRVQIATVAYALNAETLQGFPAGTGTSTIPYINSTGSLVLANASPTIQSTSGTFAVEGLAMTLTTPTASDGIVTINPDGVGTLNLTFEGAAAGASANGFVNAVNANITSGALYGGTVASAATGYNFIDFQSGVSPTSKFSISATGAITTASGLTIGTTSLSETTSPTDSGAYLVGANDEFAYSASTNVQGVLNDLDSAIAANGNGDITAVGSMTTGDVFADATADDDWLGLGAAAGRIEFDDQAVDEINFLNANVGIGTTTPGSTLSVRSTDLASVPALGANGGQFSLLGASGTFGMLEGVLSSGNTYIQAQRVDATALAYSLLLNPNGGNVGIGTTGPDAKIDSLSTTEQLRLTYTDGTVYSAHTVDSSGNLTIDNTGTKTVIADDLQITGDDLIMTTNTANYFLMADGTNYNPTSPADARTGIGLVAGGTGDIWVEKAGDTMTGSLIIQGTTGLTFNTGAGGDITFANSEKIDNDVDGTVTITAPITAVSGNLTVTGGNINNSGGTGTIVLSSTPSAINSFHRLTNGSWLVENTLNDGIAALMVNQTKGGDIFTASASGTPIVTMKSATTAKANIDLLQLTNHVNAADMDTTRTSILFNQWYYDATTPAIADAGRLTVGAETDWTSTASTQDAFLSFDTALDGTLAEKMRITSGGNVGIGTTAPTVKLQVAGGSIRIGTPTSGDANPYIDFYSTTTDSKIQNVNGHLSLGHVGGTEEALTVLLGGNVGIGTTAPTGKLQVTGDEVRIGAAGTVDVAIADGDLYVQSDLEADNTVYFTGVNTVATNNLYTCIDSNGYLHAETSCASSSLRFKENINTLSYGLNTVLQLKPVSFQWKLEQNPDRTQQIGFIAEEMQLVIPEVVLYENDGVTPKGIDYAKLTAVLTGAVQEQQLQIDKLSLNETGDIILTGDSPDTYSVATPVGTASRVEALASLFTAKLQSGYANIKETFTDTLTVSQKIISPIVETDTLIATSIDSPTIDLLREQIDNLTANLTQTTASVAAIPQFDSATYAALIELVNAPVATDTANYISLNSVNAKIANADLANINSSAGTIVGKAMESLNENSTLTDCINLETGTTEKCGLIVVFVNVNYFDPEIVLTDSGDLTVSINAQNTYEVKQSSTQSTITKIGAFAQSVIGSLRTGSIDTQELVTNSITISGQTIKDYIITTINNGISITQVETNLISPVADTNLIIDLDPENAVTQSQLAIKGVNDEIVTSFDAYGNATISGTLYANEIESERLNAIEDLLAEVENNQQLLTEASAWNTNTATSSADLTTTNLFVTGQAAMSSLFVSDNFTTKNINSLTETLGIQSLASAPLEIMAGKIKIDTDGNTKFLSNVEIAGNLTINNLIVANNTTEVATESGTIVEGEVNSNSTAGKATLAAGLTELKIINPKVNVNTLVYVTPVTSTQNKVLYVKSKADGEFTIGFNEAIDTDVEFNWWIIELQ